MAKNDTAARCPLFALSLDAANAGTVLPAVNQNGRMPFP
jgi:hypothetical protein